MKSLSTNNRENDSIWCLRVLLVVRMMSSGLAIIVGFVFLYRIYLDTENEHNYYEKPCENRMCDLMKFFLYPWMLLKFTFLVAAIILPVVVSLFGWIIIYDMYIGRIFGAA